MLKNGHAIILALLLAGCHKPSPAPVPVPAPSVSPLPSPVPVPSPKPSPAATCSNGMAIGEEGDTPCPKGQVGKHTVVCTLKGLIDVANTCAVPPPPPPPPAPVKIEMPSLYKIHKGNKLGLHAPEKTGLSYKWSTGETTPMIWVTPAADTTYSVTVTDGLTSDSADISVVVQ